MVSWESSDATAMIAPAPMAITPKRRNGHARRHPKLRSFQGLPFRSEEHTSELQSLMRNSYAVFCLKKKKPKHTHTHFHAHTAYQDTTQNDTNKYNVNTNNNK